VKADHLAGPKGRLGHLGDRQRRGVGGEDRPTWGERIQLLEDRLLDLHLLRDRLDHEIDVTEAFVFGRARDQAHQVVEALVRLLLGQLLLAHQPLQLAFGDLARLLQGTVDELLLDVLHQDWDLGGGDDLGDLPAHRAAAHHCGLEHEQLATSGRWLARGRL
jgi:hypothetical protein